MNSSTPSTPPRPWLWRSLAALLALTLTATACGSGSDDSAGTTSAASSTDDATSEGLPADGVAAGETTGDADGKEESAEASSDDSDQGDTDQANADDTGETSVDSDVTRTRLGDRIRVAELETTSGRFEGTISVSGGSELPEGIELVFTGAFDSANDASEISLDLGSIALAAAEAEGADLGPMAAMFEEPMVVRTVGNRAFISWGLFGLLTGTPGGWLETEADDAADISSSFGGTGNGSPVDILTVLENANADITEVGTEEVRGVNTTHITALIDIAELQESLSDDERATLERDLGDVPIEAFPMDIWLDDDGFVRRYSVDLSSFAAEDDDIDQAGLVFEFYDFGADITIEVPPADQIISADELDLGAFDFGN